MKTFRRFFTVLLAVALCCSFAACGDDDDNDGGGHNGLFSGDYLEVTIKGKTQRVKVPSIYTDIELDHGYMYTKNISYDLFKGYDVVQGLVHYGDYDRLEKCKPSKYDVTEVGLDLMDFKGKNFDLDLVYETPSGDYFESVGGTNIVKSITRDEYGVVVEGEFDAMMSNEGYCDPGDERTFRMPGKYRMSL